MLNAKYHEKEAEIVAQAGKQGAVTIATNMAGRGTDIMLGGNVSYMAKAALRKELSRDRTKDLAQLKDEYEHAKARAKASGTELAHPAGGDHRRPAGAPDDRVRRPRRDRGRRRYCMPASALRSCARQFAAGNQARSC